MNLKLVRYNFTQKSTSGKLFLNEEFQCHTLEDVDRSLRSDMSLEEIQKIKVYGETAIPTGIYRVDIDMSSRFHRLLPHILDVKGFEGVRIHPGNKPEDTEGCILVGTISDQNAVLHSRDAFSELFPKLLDAVSKGDDITLNIIHMANV
jgi:hypothetical protein